MVRGEEVMPIPEGEITTAEILVPEVVPVEDEVIISWEEAKDDLSKLP